MDIIATKFMYTTGREQVKQIKDADNRELDWEVLRICTYKGGWISTVIIIIMIFSIILVFFYFKVSSSFHVILFCLKKKSGKDLMSKSAK